MLLCLGLASVVPAVWSQPLKELADLEKTYAPVLILDSRERSPLTSVEQHLKLGVALKGDLDKQALTLEPQITLEQLAAYPSAEYQYQGARYQLYLDANRQVAPLDNVVYTQRIEQGDFIYLQYWFFYSYNDTSTLGGPPGGLAQKCGNHEADWEHLGLRIDTQLYQKARNEQELREAIDDIYLSQHARAHYAERKWFRSADPRLKFEGSHLTLYPSNGSHASYHAPGSYNLLKILGFQMRDSNDGKGRRIDTYQGRLLPLKQQAWFDFGGRWGAISHDACNMVESVSPASNDGPYGPGKGGNPSVFEQSDWYDMQQLRPPLRELR